MKEQLLSCDCRRVHNFSVGVLDAYFRLSESYQARQVQFHDGVLLVDGTAKKVFVYTEPKDKGTLPRLRNRSHVYTLEPLASLGKPTGEFKETGYNLAKVMDPASYPNAKKRHQRIRYPKSWFDKHGMTVSQMQVEDIPEITKLHDTWAQRVLDRPDTFKINFPGARYLRCCTAALQVNYFTTPADYLPLVIRYQGRIVAFRVFYLQRGVAYDLAFVSCYWELPSQSTEYINFICFDQLYTRGIQFLNAGFSAGIGQLTQFKEHYPSEDVVSYVYSKKKSEKPKGFFIDS